MPNLDHLRSKPAQQFSDDDWQLLLRADKEAWGRKILELSPLPEPAKPEPIVVQAPPPPAPPARSGYTATDEHAEIKRLLKLKKERELTDEEHERLHDLGEATGVMTAIERGMLAAIREQFDLVRARLDKLEAEISSKADAERVVQMHNELENKISAIGSNIQRGYYVKPQ